MKEDLLWCSQCLCLCLLWESPKESLLPAPCTVLQGTSRVNLLNSACPDPLPEGWAGVTSVSCLPNELCSPAPTLPPSQPPLWPPYCSPPGASSGQQWQHWPGRTGRWEQRTQSRWERPRCCSRWWFRGHSLLMYPEWRTSQMCKEWEISFSAVISMKCANICYDIAAANANKVSS